MSTEPDHRGPLLAIILAGYAMAVPDVSIVMVALPRIQHVLGFSATERPELDARGRPAGVRHRPFRECRLG